MNPRPSASLALLTFDLSGTLIEPSPPVGRTYAEIASRHGVAADAARIAARFPSALRRWTHGEAQRHSPRHERKIWREVVREALAEEGIPEDLFEPVFSELFEAYATGARWRVLPGSVEVLELLMRRGFRLAALSNSDSRMRRVLRELEIDTYFEALFLSGEVGFEKPDPRLFRHVSRVMEVAPEAILHVGDSVRHDAEGPESAGWRHFLVRPGQQTLATLPAIL